MHHGCSLHPVSLAQDQHDYAALDASLSSIVSCFGRPKNAPSYFKMGTLGLNMRKG